MSSTTAKFNKPKSVFGIPCDLCFPFGPIKWVDEAVVAKFADNGCVRVIKGGHKNNKSTGGGS